MEIPQIKTDFKPLNEILYTVYELDTVIAALEIDLFDALSEGPADATALAARLGTIENLTEALADVLTAMKLLEKNGAQYSLQPIAREFLVKSSKVYQGETIKSYRVFGRVMSQIPGILKTGPARPDKDMWIGLDLMKNMGKGSMSGSLQDVAAFITRLPEFPELKHICDLGGNHGFYTMALLDRNTGMRATLCDLPNVTKVAEGLIAEMGYADRMDVIGVDIETEASFGEEYDLVFTSHFLYGWKGRLEKILNKINRALVPGGIFVSNHMAMTGDYPVSSTILELMTRLLGYPTHHLSENELKNALEACGFGGFEVMKPEDARQNNSLLLAARKL